MSNKRTLTDRRLLAALDYIDQKYIDDVFGIINEPKSEDNSQQTFISTALKHWKSIAALAACVVLLAFAAPTVSFISQVISNFTAGAGGNAGAGTSELEAPTQAETQTLETEAADSEAIDSGFEEYLEAFADMSADEIYAEVLKGGWVVIDDDNCDFDAGKDLWLDFFEKSQKGEPAYALVADYWSIDDRKSEIVLVEIVFDGNLFYYKRSYNKKIDSDEYKYLKYGIATQDTIRFADEAYFLTNCESMTLDDFNENMLRASQTFPVPVAVIYFRK